MLEYLEDLLKKYQHRGIVFDSPLLLVYCVGLYDRRRISSFKRTKEFSDKDFKVIGTLVNSFSQSSAVLATPNIFTEVTNLGMQLPLTERRKFLVAFKTFFPKIHEYYAPSPDLTTKDSFLAIGLTDSSIVELSVNNYLVVTNDYPLKNVLEHQHVDVIHYDTYRTTFYEFNGIS